MRVCLVIIVTLVLSISACISQNTTRPDNVTRTQSPTSTPAAEDDHTAERAVERISIVDAQAAVSKGEAVFLDVRQANVYQLGHIAGALSLPEGDIPLRGPSLPREKKIITYCS